MNGTPEITISELLTHLSGRRPWVKRFAAGDKDAVIDEVIDDIAGQSLQQDERDARFSPDRRAIVKDGSFEELQAAVASEWPGAVIMIHVC